MAKPAVSFGDNLASNVVLANDYGYITLITPQAASLVKGGPVQK